jgi:pimeloyl-ACP methyl ester carboxylesterase
LSVSVKSLIGLMLWAIGAVASASTFTPHHRVHIEGEGPRTIILESGFGDTSYNRAGYLDSEPATAARDAASIVSELREELQRRNLNPPYVLVGHSLGGLYMQYFARNFPGEVAGLVLIDSTHWQQGLKVDTTADTPYQSRTAITLYMPLVMRRELSDSAEAGLEVNGSPSAWAIPTVVLSSTRIGPIETADQRALAVTLQNSIAADFPGARHVFVENSGHYIQRDRPAVVIDAIRDVAGCSSLNRR